MLMLLCLRVSLLKFRFPQFGVGPVCLSADVEINLFLLFFELTASSLLLFCPVRSA